MAIQGTRSIFGIGRAIAKSVERGLKRREISFAGIMAKIEGDGQYVGEVGVQNVTSQTKSVRFILQDQKTTKVLSGKGRLIMIGS